MQSLNWSQMICQGNVKQSLKSVKKLSIIQEQSRVRAKLFKTDLRLTVNDLAAWSDDQWLPCRFSYLGVFKLG
jgi:hypothetical protein